MSYRLAAVDSVGVEMGDAAYVFGATAHCCHEGGGAVVLDRINGTVRLFSRNGVHSGTIHIRGSGPGEFGDPTGVVPLSLGRFAVYSPFDRKLSVHDPESGFLFEILNTTGSLMGPMETAAINDTSLVSRFYHFSEDSVSGVLYLQTPSPDVPAIELARKTVPTGEGTAWHHDASFIFTASSSGTVYVSEYSFDSYRIERISMEGELLGVIERKHAPILKTDEEIEAETDVFQRRFVHAQGTASAPEYTPAPYHYSIVSLAVDGTGRLWVGQGGEAGACYEVYSPEGAHLFQCRFEPPRWQDADGWLVTIDRFGILASPVNPDLYPLVYILELAPI